MAREYTESFIVKSYDELTQKQINDIYDKLSTNNDIEHERNEEEEYIYENIKNDIEQNSKHKCGYNIELKQWDSSSQGAYNIIFMADSEKGDIEIECQLDNDIVLFVISHKFEFTNILPSPIDFIYENCDVYFSQNINIDELTYKGKRIRSLDNLILDLYNNNVKIKRYIKKILDDISPIVDNYLSLIEEYINNELLSIDDYLMLNMPEYDYTFKKYNNEEIFVGYNRY